MQLLQSRFFNPAVARFVGQKSMSLAIVVAVQQNEIRNEEKPDLIGK
jgi:hypothetical protein